MNDKNTYSFKVMILALRKNLIKLCLKTSSASLLCTGSELQQGAQSQCIRWIKATGRTQNEKVEAGTNKTHIPRLE